MMSKKPPGLSLEEKKIRAFQKCVAELGEWFPDYVVSVRTTEGTVMRFSDRNWAYGCMRRCLLEWDAMDRKASEIMIEDKMMDESGEE